MVIVPEKTISRRWWSYLRFSLRGLIVLVLAVGIWLGWIVRSVRIQRDAVAAIEHAGGGVSYDWCWKDGAKIPNGKPWWPKWLIDRLGADYFRRVTRAGVGPGPAPDGELAQIGHLGQLEVLVLFHSRGTNAGLANLKGLGNLRELYLEMPHATDAGLVYLKGLRSLESLLILNTPVTDAGLVHLKELTSLRNLDLLATQVTDEGVTELKRALPNLEVSYVTFPPGFSWPDGDMPNSPGRLGYLENQPVLESIVAKDKVNP